MPVKYKGILIIIFDIHHLINNTGLAPKLSETAFVAQ